MKATELRIGNYVSWCDEITQLDKGKLYYIFGSPYKSPLCNIEPIPLTEQWPKDFGFRYSYDRWGKREGRKTIYVEIDSSGIVTVLAQFDIGLDIHKIDSNGEYYEVHTFQNLYFALCGKELVKS